MLNVVTIVEHADIDHEVTRLSVQVGPLPNDNELHRAISAACLKAIEELLGCQAIEPSQLN